MKDYLIWTRSGNCINGTMNEKQATKLRRTCKSGSNQMEELHDTEGVLLIRMSEVEAVGINARAAPSKPRKIGFNQ